MSAPTINGLLLSAATITVPRWGLWTADVEITTGEALGGTVQLDVGGLALTGTVVEGGPYRQSGWYRIVGGAAGWRKTIPAAPYRAEIGVKLSTVLQAAASACGETMGTVPPTKIGVAFDRFEGPAAGVLELLVADAWYVDEVGVTQVGARASAAFAAEYTILRSAPDRRFATISAEDISALLPGAIVDIDGAALTVASVRHELAPSGLRSHLWGEHNDPSDRLVGAFRGLVNALLGRRTDYHRLCGYRVTAVSDGYVDVQPLRSTMGLPDLANVPTWGGMGGGGDPALGSKCLVGFVDGDPCQPAVLHYEGESGSAHVPQEATLNASVLVKLGGGAQFVPLDNLLQNELAAIATYSSTHTHSVPALGTSGTPSAPYTPGATAATKVKAT